MVKKYVTHCSRFMQQIYFTSFIYLIVKMRLSKVMFFFSHLLCTFAEKIEGLKFFSILHSWGFLGWATTWGNERVSQSFWVLENNSVVLKSLFCGIVWCEIQSYRKATCNFVVLTFIKKRNLLHQGSNPGPSDQKPDALPDELLRLWWGNGEFLWIL